MITEKAKIVAINNSTVIVESLIKSSCSGCQQVDNCGSGQIAKALPHRKLTIEIHNHLHCNIGDQVTIAIPEDKLLASAWQVYCLPLLFLILFSFLGEYISQQLIISHELFTILLGCLGGYIGFRLAKTLQARMKIREGLTPRIISID